MTTGILTGIQRFSLNDGPGIRTTVFFQGCNMRCAWCHNPETIPQKPRLMFYPLKCIGCGRCVSVCPTGAHKTEDGAHIIDRSVCVSCGKCANECFSGALVMSGRAYTVKEALGEIVQDRLYYEQSGGGVTFSGGESTLQGAFLTELARACHAAGVHTALETNLLLPFETLRPILKEMDLVMFDLKLSSSARHEDWTGVKNDTVLENIRQLDSLGIPLIARTPLIPGATDSAEDLQGNIDHLKRLNNLRCYELLNFNPLGGSKSEALGVIDPFSCARPLTPAALEALQKQLRVPDGFSIRVR